MNQIPAGHFAALSARLAARRGAPLTPVTPDMWAAWEARSERQQRARDAHASGRRRPLFKREQLPPPTYTKQFTPAGSTLAARDGRLTDGAARLLDVIRALAGAERVIEWITKAYLAKILPAPDGGGRSPRTVQRHLEALVAGGYIRRTLVLNGLGAVIGQRIELTELAIPAHECRQIDQGKAFAAARAEWETACKGQAVDFRAKTFLSPIKGSNIIKGRFSQHRRNAERPLCGASAPRGRPGG